MVILPLSILITTLIAAILAGSLCGLLGVFVVKMEITSVGFCEAHAAFAGIAFGMFLQIQLPLLMGMFFAISTAFIIGPLSQLARIPSSVILGVLFTFFMAVGITLLNFLPGPVVGQQAFSILWGSILAVTYLDLFFLFVLTIFVISLIFLFRKEFFAVLFSRKMAEADGINANVFVWMILFLTGFAVSLSLKLVGGLLIYSLIVVPTSTVSQLFYDIKKITIASPILGAINCVLGVFFSLFANFPVGSAIVLISSAIFGVTTFFSPKRKRG